MIRLLSLRRLVFATLLLITTLFLLSHWQVIAQDNNERGVNDDQGTAETAGSPDPRRFPAPQSVTCIVTIGDDSPLPACHALVQADRQEPMDLDTMRDVPCENGRSGIYPCHNVNLLSFLPLSQLGGGNGNDLWGWTDSQTGKEYAIMGRNNGTAFVDISDPTNPVYLGNLPSHEDVRARPSSIWRDVKTYKNYAYVVADLIGEHGMQVFDLTQLRDVAEPPVTFTETAHYDEFGSAHNIVINEASGYAYAVGVSAGQTRCNSGMHMISLKKPASPSFAGCYGNDGYTHDAQCVIYQGPDETYRGQEICFNASEDAVTIVDVTNKNGPQLLSRTGYVGSAYTHQGWLTPDQRYLVVNDELDEQTFEHNTRSYIWDVGDLSSPELIGAYTADVASIDHNLYIHRGMVFEANYRSGLRVLGASGLAEGNLAEVAYFDVYPSDDRARFNGAWSSYPFFDSGAILVSGIEQGLFVLELDDSLSPPLVFLPAIVRE